MDLNRMAWIVFVVMAFLSLPCAAGEIHQAAEKGDAAVVQKFLEQDQALLNAPDEKGRTPLHLAAFNGRTEVVQLLIRRGAELDRKEESYDLTPLHMAAWKGHAGAVRLLLDAGADLNARERDNEIPLYYAATADSTETIDLLLSKGADLNDSQSKAGNTVLSLAIERGQNKIAEYLIQKGADVKFERDHGTLLHGAAWRGTKPLIDLLVSKGLDVNARNASDITPLFLSSSAGNVEGTRALLDHGARVDFRSKSGESPLWIAVARGQKEIVGLLLKAGADPGAVMPECGLSLLHKAAIRGYGDIVAQLAAKGADLNAKDPAGKTPLDYTLQYGQKTSAGILAARGAATSSRVNGRQPMGDFAKDLREGEAQVWYLEHSGWAVRTSNHVLVFDYMVPRVPPDDPSLANGIIDPKELAHENVVVFASHAHSDHYAPEMFEWKRDIDHIQYVLGFKPDTKEAFTFIAPMRKLNLDGLEVTATLSNDGGVAFFVRADGVSIYHAGDHANRKPEVTEDFSREIDVLARNGLKPDLLFVPVSGCGFGDPESVRKGAYYTVEKLTPKIVFPMHAGGGEVRLRKFAQKAQEDGLKGEFLTPAHPGDRFLVRNGVPEALAKR